MKTLNTLIKLHKHKIETVLYKVRRQEMMKSSLELQKQQLNKKILLESKQYFNSSYAYMLDVYLSNSRRVLQGLEGKIIDIRSTLNILYNELHTQYTELKKFEIALANKRRLEIARIKKVEGATIDEFSNMQKYVV